MNDLANLKCIPCSGEEPPLTSFEIKTQSLAVPDWQVVDQDGMPQLKRTFKFKNFARALAFTNQVGEIAEQQDHHPAILTEWGKVTVTWWTHKIKGLHQNDFIMAAKTNQLYETEQKQE